MPTLSIRNSFRRATLACAAAALFAAPLSGQVKTNAAGPSMTTVASATQPAKVPNDQPAQRFDKNGKPNAKFMQMHESFLKRAKEGPIGLLFLGDSITERWSTVPDLWKERFEKYQPANFGISGDTTQYVLWRIQHGELDDIHPKVVVLMIGTNNTTSTTPDEVFAGVREVLNQTLAKLPQTRVILLCMPPRGTRTLPDGRVFEWTKVKQDVHDANLKIKTLADGDRVRNVDLTDKLSKDGIVGNPDLLPDGVHPNEKGYRIWADAMQPMLDEMMPAPAPKAVSH